MRRSLAIAAIVLIAVAALTYLQWHVRATGAARTIAPVSLVTLEFKTLIGEGRWMPIAPEDAPGMVAAFNLNRRQLARMTTPVFATNGDLVALAPLALLRYDEQVVEWHIRMPDDSLLEKYAALSLRDEVASNEPTITARQINPPNSGDIEIVVVDPHTKAATIVVFARKSYHDVKFKAYRYGEGMAVMLKADGPAGHYRGRFSVDEVVHQGTLAIEYTYNDLPESHNDHTRMVSCQVTMLFH